MKKCSRCNSQKTIVYSTHKFHNICKCLDCNNLILTTLGECCNDPFLNVTIDNKNPERLRLHRQCQNCGGCVDRNKPLSQKQYSKEIRFEFSYLNYNNWANERKENSTQLWEFVKPLNYSTSRFAKYTEYLSSNAWALKRKEVLFRDENLCQICKEKPAEQVHHKTYVRLYDEALEDLISVCKICHDEIHSEIDENRRAEIRQMIDEQKGSS